MYSIGQLAKQTGVKVPTIRYYEQVGLLQNAGRSSGNQRRYSREGLERLSFIRHARDLGLSLEDIRELADLSLQPNMPCTKAHDVAARHLTAIQSRIKKLLKLEQELTRIAKTPDEGHVGACYVIQTLADHSMCDGDH